MPGFQIVVAAYNPVRMTRLLGSQSKAVLNYRCADSGPSLLEQELH
jgi:hypothetical protein